MLKKILFSILIPLLISCGNTKKDSSTSVVASLTSTEQEAINDDESTPAIDTSFLVQELANNVYLLNPADTIFLDKPFIKHFTGEVDGREAQLWLMYSLPSMEGLCTRYARKAHLYVDGDKDIHFFILDDIYPENYVVVDDDKEKSYDYEYINGDNKITIKTVDGRFTLSESSTKLTATDAFGYANVYCDFQDMVRSHWSYRFDFGVNENDEEAEFFANARLAAGLGELKKQKNNIKTEVLRDVEDDEDESYCYTLYDHIVTQPLYLDSTIFVIATYSDIYMGGAHGIYGTSYYNIDRKTGELITLEEVLDLTNEHFLEYHKNKLMEEYELEPDMVELPTDFFILPTGIWLHYPPYSLGGGFWEKEIFLPYHEIENYLRRDIY